MKKIIKEFKEFAMKGNVLDLAVGVVIGGAFGKIVSSLVKDVIMPIIGLITGGINFTYLKITLKHGIGDKPPITLNIGNFIQNVVDFIIIAFSIFMFIKLISKLQIKKVEEEKEKEEETPSDEVVLLQEIRDLLKKDNK
ncbi:large-conductance mechanosensitive channel protein MscL [Clostridium novyi]|nr:large-conductance mechanosensitive channel protein MscL [Clostridium novyi]